MKSVPCLCCGQPMDVVPTKAKGKPYVACEPCGVQTFVRGKDGVQKFAARYDWKPGEPAAATPPTPPTPAPTPKSDPVPTPTTGGAPRARRSPLDF